jgi:UDP-glucose 4-epimerase
MRVLITGGAGFIGSHLADSLLRKRQQVTALDDLSTGSLENVAHLLDDPAFTFRHDSIFNRPLIETLIAESDIVYHLAAAVGVKRIIESPVETIETNVAGSEIVLRLAAEHSTRVIFASTSEVYGKSTQLPFREEGDLVLGPTSHTRWGYACSKAIDEFLALAFHRQCRLPVTIVRLFNTVGPRQIGRYGMVVPTFVTQALLGEDITVYGTGDQSRCFTHVFDIVEGLAAIAERDATIGEIYNLGSTEEVSMNQLATLVLDATGSPSRIVHVPYELAYAPGFEDMQRRLPDISKAKAAFNFQPRRNLEQVLADVITDMRARLNLQGQSPVAPNIEEHAP